MVNGHAGDKINGTSQQSPQSGESFVITSDPHHKYNEGWIIFIISLMKRKLFHYHQHDEDEDEVIRGNGNEAVTAELFRLFCPPRDGFAFTYIPSFPSDPHQLRCTTQ